MRKEDLKALQGKFEAPCISINIPTHRVSSEKQQDYIRLKNAVKKVSETLNSQYDKKQVKPLIDKMEQILEELDYSRLLEGLGIFLSPDIEKIVHLPFPVEEKTIIDDTFEVRDLLLAMNKLIDYQLLLLNEDQVRFFRGKGTNIREYKDEQFPAYFDKNEYEYQKANFVNPATNSIQGTIEKANVEQKKINHFLAQVDEKLKSYLNSNIPLFIMGDRNIIGEYDGLTKHKNHIKGRITGNYQHLAAHEIADKAQIELNRYLDEQRDKALKQLEEEVGFDRVSSGLANVYKDAVEGKGSVLLVEKGYSQPAYLDENNYKLYVDPEDTTGLKKMNDAVDDVMEEIVNKNGEVKFVDNGKLHKYGRIAMILRFNQA